MTRVFPFRCPSFLVLVFAIIFLAFSPLSIANIELEQEFKTAINQLPTSFRGELASSIDVVVTRGKSQDSRRFELDISGSKIRLKEPSKSGNSAIHRITNDTYLFGLSEKKGKFSLVALESLGTEVGQKLLQDQKTSNEPLLAIHAGVHLFGMPLRDVINSKDFRLISVEKQEKGLVRINFQFEYNYGGKYPVIVEPSFFVCDSSQSWGIVAYETKTIEGKDKVRHDLRCEVGLRVLDDGFPIAVSVVQNDVESKDARSTCRWSISVKDSRPDDAVFQLSHYGFAEPKLESSRIWIYLPLILVSLTCLVTSLMWWKIRRKHGLTK